VIFVSMLVYPLESAKRFAAERCLWQLLCQLDSDDVLLTFEKPQLTDRDWEKGANNWIPDERIRDYWQRAMIFEHEWDFYFGTGLFIANKAFLAFIDEWQMLTNKSRWFPEETALVTLAHKYRNKWHIVWLPDELHFVGWKVRQGEEHAAAVHIGSTEISRWLSYASRFTHHGGE